METTTTELTEVKSANADCEKVINILEMIIDDEATSEDQSYFYTHLEDEPPALPAGRAECAAHRIPLRGVLGGNAVRSPEKEDQRVGDEHATHISRRPGHRRRDDVADGGHDR